MKESVIEGVCMRVVAAVLGAGLMAISLGPSASEFNGSVKGAVDGQPIDVSVVCDRGDRFLQAKSDPSMYGATEDRDGDGIAVTVSAMQGMGRAIFEVVVADQFYRFTGRRDLVFTELGLQMKSTVNRYEGTGADSRVIGSFDVDLSLECSS
jgi:hypothetical protein